MPISTQAAKSTRRAAKSDHAVSTMETWKLEDAKARLSEVVRLAATNGPQLVTVRGKEAAVILAPEQYKQHLPKPKGHLPLVQFLQGLGLDNVVLEREIDTGRELAL